MATYLENITTVRDQVAANLVDMTENPKPNYTIGDETYEWATLFDIYTRQLQKLNELLAGAEPFEIRTRRLVR